MNGIWINLSILLLLTCGYTSAYIDERDMKGETTFGVMTMTTSQLMIAIAGSLRCCKGGYKL